MTSLIHNLLGLKHPSLVTLTALVSALAAKIMKVSALDVFNKGPRFGVVGGYKFPRKENPEFPAAVSAPASVLFPCSHLLWLKWFL